MMPSTLDKKRQKKHNVKKNDNGKIAMEALHENDVEFSDTKNFNEEYLERKCFRENISVEELTSFSWTSLWIKSYHSKHFLLCSVRL